MGSQAKSEAKKTNQYILYGLIMLAVFGAVGLFLVYNGQQQAAFAGEQGVPQGTGINTLPDCGDNPAIQFKAYILDPNNNNQYTLVSTNAAACTIGNPVCDVTVVTNASSATTATGVSCGAKYRQVIGDQGVTYYYALSGEYQINNPLVLSPRENKGLLVVPSGPATALIKDSTNNYAATLTFNWTAAGKTNNSVDDTDMSLRVQSPGVPAVFGDLGYAICFRYDSSNFTYMKAGTKTVSITHVKPSGVKNTVMCSEQPELLSGKYVEVPLSVKGATAGPVNGTTVDVILVAKTNEFFNGYLVPFENTAAGVLSNGYDALNDPNTGLVTDIEYTDMLTIST